MMVWQLSSGLDEGSPLVDPCVVGTAGDPDGSYLSWWGCWTIPDFPCLRHYPSGQGLEYVPYRQYTMTHRI